MPNPIRSAGDKFNSTQAKQVSIAVPRMELGREMSMPVGGGILDSQSSPPIPTQGQQGFLGSRQIAGGGARFQPMGGAQAPRPVMSGAPAPQAELSGEEEHVIDVYGIDPNGNELVATFGAIFPRGTRFLGAQKRQ